MNMYAYEYWTGIINLEIFDVLVHHLRDVVPADAVDAEWSLGQAHSSISCRWGPHGAQFVAYRTPTSAGHLPNPASAPCRQPQLAILIR